MILFVFSLSRARIQFGWANFGDYLQNVSICDCVCFCLRSRLCNTSYKDRCCHFPPQRQIHEIHLWGGVVVISKKGQIHPKAKICHTKHYFHPTIFHVFCKVSGLYCTNHKKGPQISHRIRGYPPPNLAQLLVTFSITTKEAL